MNYFVFYVEDFPFVVVVDLNALGFDSHRQVFQHEYALALQSHFCFAGNLGAVEKYGDVFDLGLEF